MSVNPEELKVGQVVKVQYFLAHAPNFIRIDRLPSDNGLPYAVSGVFVTAKGEVNRRYRPVPRTTSVRNVLSIIKQPEEVTP